MTKIAKGFGAQVYAFDPSSKPEDILLRGADPVYSIEVSILSVYNI